MSQPRQSFISKDEAELQRMADEINEALKNYSDKDWNYSRFHLQINSLAELDSPYVLWCEILDMKSKSAKEVHKSLVDEITWGDRHSNELGILEIVSLRINKALLESTSDESWNYSRPVVRIIRKELL